MGFANAPTHSCLVYLVEERGAESMSERCRRCCRRHHTRRIPMAHCWNHIRNLVPLPVPRHVFFRFFDTALMLTNYRRTCFPWHTEVVPPIHVHNFAPATLIGPLVHLPQQR